MGLGDAVTFVTAQAIDPVGARLNNGNYFIAYYDDADSTKPKFVIVQEDGTSVKGVTLLSADTNASDIAITLLDNNNVFVAYNADLNSPNNLGRFVIFDEDGASVKGVTTFHTGGVSDVCVLLLDNTNVFLAYSEDGSNNLDFTILDEDGTEVVAETQVVAAGGYMNQIVKLSNSNVVIAYGGSPNSYLQTYTQAGVAVLGQTQFKSGFVIQVCPIVLTNGNIMIGYDAGSDGRFVIVDSSGTEVVSETVFTTTTDPWDLAGVLIGPATVLLTYNSGTSTDPGYYIVYTQEGLEQISETVFEARAFSSHCVAKSGISALIFYYDQGA